MRILIKILNLISTLIFIVMAALMLIFAPMLLGYKPAVILTGSMEPTFPEKSVVYYKSTEFQEIQVGDPIIYQSNDVLVTHRVVEKNDEEQYVKTKGDANNAVDSYEVFSSSVKGVVHFSIPYVGYAALIIQNKAIFVILITVLLLKIILSKLYEEDDEEEKMVA